MGVDGADGLEQLWRPAATPSRRTSQLLVFGMPKAAIERGVIGKS
jgi:chemotaxis response regulator CheB